MATAINDLEGLQFGIETTPGTLVAADTRVVVAEGGTFSEMETRMMNEAPRGVTAEVETLRTRRHSELTIEGWYNGAEILLPLLCGLKSTTGAGAAPYVWTFAPRLTRPETLKAATFEISYTDGATRHRQVEFGYATCSRIGLDLALGEPAMYSADFFGRAAQASSYTAALAVLSTRNPVQSDLFGVYIDPTWAALGTTKKSGLVRSASLEIMTGVGPDYTLDGRSDLDMTQLMRGGKITGTLDLTMEFDGEGSDEYDAWKAGTRRAIRLLATGPGNNITQIDMWGEYTEPPSFAVEDGLRTMSIVLRIMYDATSTNAVSWMVTNDVATF